MKRVFVLLLTGTVLAGCAGNTELVRRANMGERSDIFSVVSTATPPDMGYADLTIRASVKTHHQGTYPLVVDAHGTTGYELLVNIDGQKLRLPGEPRKEDSSPDSLRDPDAGDGIRYLFRAHLRVKAGTHQVISALPGDNLAVAREVLLAGGSDYLLELEPDYYTGRNKSSTGLPGSTSFREGIRTLRVTLNGVEL